MPKTVVYDTIEQDYARVEVRNGDVRVWIHFAVVSSATGEKIWYDKDVSHLLTTEQKQTIIEMAKDIQTALEEQELQ